MNNIPTAEEFKNKEYSDVYWDENTAIEFAIEFAKLHVEATLKEASKSKSLCTTYTNDGLDYKEMRLSEQSVLNAYPLTNIK